MPAPTPEALLEHTEFVRALALRLLGDEHRADDVTQQTMVAALQHPPRDSARLKPWLGRVVRNFAFRSWRDAARRTRREQQAPPRREIPSAAEILEREDARRDVVVAVLELEEPYRSTIILRFLEELPPREVARHMDVPVETVRTRTRRALARLRERLAQRQPDGWRASLGLLAAKAGMGVTAVSTKSKWMVAALVALLLALLPIWLAGRGGGKTGTRADSPRASHATATTPQPKLGSDETPPVQPADGATIRGTVVANGAPVAGAFVVLSGNGRKVGRRFTDATGRFSFEKAGAFELHAAHPEYAPAHALVQAIAGETKTVTLTLGSGQTVAVQVLDARTGRPLEDAEVLVTLSGDATNGAIETMAFTDGIWSLVPRFAVFDSLMEAFQSLGGAAVVYVPLTRVDKQGLAHLRGLRRGRFAAIVTRRGYAPVLVRSDDASGALEVSMEPGGSLRVVAPETDADTAAALVCEINRPGVFLPMPVDRATVDAQGEARFEDITPGLYEVVVSKRGTWSIDVTAPTDEREGQLNVGRNTNDVVARRTVEVAAGAAVTVDFRKDTSVSIEGKVNTALTVPWTVRLMHGGSELGTKTIAAGKTFRFETVAAGTYELIATGIQGGGVIRKTVEVAAGAGSVFVSLEAKIGGIRGTVTRDGRPVNGATMLALPYERARALAWVAPATTTELLTLLGASFRSDESGSFAQPLHAGRYMVFAALAGVLDQREVVVRESESAAIRFELGGTRVFPLEIALTNANGDPLDGHVLVRGYYGGFVAAFLLDRGAFDPDAAPRRKLVYHVPAGRYLVDVLAAGQAPVRSLPVHTKGEYTLTIPMRPGVAATITLETERGPLAGVDLDVRDARGLPIPRRAHPSVLFSRSHPWRTDKGGVVSIPHLLPGDYRLFRNDRELAAFRVRSEPVVRTIRVSSE